MDRYEVSAPRMTCTRCFRDAGDVPHYEEIDGDLLCAIATGWLCSECLDIEERQQTTPAAANPESEE